MSSLENLDIRLLKIECLKEGGISYLFSNNKKNPRLLWDFVSKFFKNFYFARSR